VCHPGDSSIPGARRYSCADGYPVLSYCTSCDQGALCTPTVNYTTTCSNGRKWMCLANEIPYPAIGAVYDRKYRSQTSDSCGVGGASDYATEGSFATCVPSATTPGLFVERRCEGFVRCMLLWKILRPDRCRVFFFFFFLFLWKISDSSVLIFLLRIDDRSCVDAQCTKCVSTRTNNTGTQHQSSPPLIKSI
jgi:hypothetical protein